MPIPSLDSGMTATVVHMASDKNDRFVLKNCVKYMIRHFERFPSFDRQTLEMLCWLLGEDMVRIGEYLLDHADQDDRAELQQELSECDLNPDDYAVVLSDRFKKTRSVRSRKFRAFILKLLHLRYRTLGYRGASEIEKNMREFKKMFGLSDQEMEFAVFLFIVTSYPFVEEFFDHHLEYSKFIGHKYLANILGLSKAQLKAIFYGKLARMGLYVVKKWGFDIEDDFFDLIHNPENRKFSQNFYFKVPRGTVPLDHYFIDSDKIEHIFGLLKHKPKSSTHLLIYGPPGTGKTSFAYSLIKQLEVPGYEIVRSNENTAEKRRAAILACLNMTNFGSGSIVLVDEADNLLNTRNSWFSRGETQDKGWLNQLLEKPGVRMIWVTNRIDGIEDSVLRRFNYKLGFDYLTPEGNVIFYEMFLSSLASGLLDEDLRKELKKVKNLAPGDFKVVRDRCCFQPKEEIPHALLVDGLKAEASLKDCHKNEKQIGF
jgi:transitional endoplasmic reticulum ATPase